MRPIHPLVRDLYKRALLAGRDYPHPEGMDYVRRKWKMALRDSRNCPSCYDALSATAADPSLSSERCEREIRKSVGRGRHMIREMVGIIQLKKYRVMRSRYGEGFETK